MLYQLSKELDKHVPSFGQHRYVYGAIKGLFRILLDEAQKDNKRCSLIFVGHNAYSRGGVVLHNKETSLITLRCFIPSNLEQSFDSTIYIMMLTETRNVLSLALYLANTTSCTTCVIVQDGIDLMTQGLEKKAVLASLTGFAVPTSNIVL